MRWTVSAAAIALAACGQTQVAPGPAPTAGGDCAALAKLALPDTTITSSELVAAGAFTPSAQSPMPAATFVSMPEFCRVAAQVKPTSDSDIRFEVWLPAKGWNGKFMGTGNGGAAGTIIQGGMIDPLKRGYAVANTDTGHTGGTGDFAWAAGQQEKLVDYAWRAVHLMTARSKDIVKAYYTAPPKRSYWLGCSTGGRQGLKEVQRFPADYDGVIAGAPAANWDRLNTHSVQAQLELTNAASGLPPNKLSVLFEAAIGVCDANDGVRDRVISEPGKCKFDPAVAQCTSGDAPSCLTAAQVSAARRLYRGVITPEGSPVYPGTGPGSEPGWAAFASPGFRIGESYYRHVVKNDPKWSAANFKFADLAEAEKLDNGLLTAMDPDISAFTRRGGKLILWHGQTDGLITAQNTANYYESVAAKLGAQTTDNVRLFLAPGVNHCSGGEGPSNVDWIDTLERWVERDEAPARVIASKPLPGGATRTRPLCAYPQVAKYSGSGDEEKAESFVCSAT